MLIDQLSRFKNTDPIIYKGVETFGKWAMPSFLTTRPADEDIRVFRVNNVFAGRPDLIANQVYGTSTLDWVIIAFNGVRNTLNWPRAGDVIEYPSDTVVLPALL